eukprot:87231-Hanusia_phi.AAC.2
MSGCSLTSDRVCGECSELALTCPLGTFLYGCGGGKNGTCERCGVCGAGLYQAAPCTSMGNTSCQSCLKYHAGVCLETQYLEGCVGGFPGTCQWCGSCSEGKYMFADCQELSGVKCETCKTCELGKYKSGGCVGDRDTECSTCRTCVVGEYEASGCASDRNRNCTACRVCDGGEYQTRECTVDGDRQCSSCAERAASCGAGSFLDGCGHGEQGRCMACSVCGANDYQSGVCGGQSNTTCASCLSLWRGTCDTTGGQYRSGCGGGAFGVCAPCKACGAGEYVVKACEGNRNTNCSSCASLAESCGAGTFLDGCGDGVPGACQPCRECSGGKYRTSECTKTADTGCDDCSTYAEGNCPAGSYLSGCGGASEGKCKLCAACAEGFYRPADQHCGGVSSGVCANCTARAESVCGDGMYLDGCGGDSAGRCAACRACTGGDKEILPCLPWRDRTCGQCKVCAPGMYQTACVGGVASCSPCRTCAAAQYTTGGCDDGIRDRNCTDCTEVWKSECGGYEYLDGCGPGSRGVCKPCSQCEAGLSEVSVCSALSNTRCGGCVSACGLSQYLEQTDNCPASGQGYCRTCRVCNASEYEVS